MQNDVGCGKLSGGITTIGREAREDGFRLQVVLGECIRDRVSFPFCVINATVISSAPAQCRSWARVAVFLRCFYHEDQPRGADYAVLKTIRAEFRRLREEGHTNGFPHMKESLETKRHTMQAARATALSAPLPWIQCRFRFLGPRHRCTPDVASYG